MPCRYQILPYPTLLYLVGSREREPEVQGNEDAVSLLTMQTCPNRMLAQWRLGIIEKKRIVRYNYVKADLSVLTPYYPTTIYLVVGSNIIQWKFKNSTMRRLKKILGWLIVITIYGGIFLLIASERGTMVTATSFAVLFILVGALVLAEKLTSGKL